MQIKLYKKFKDIDDQDMDIITIGNKTIKDATMGRCLGYYLWQVPSNDDKTFGKYSEWGKSLHQGKAIELDKTDSENLISFVKGLSIPNGEKDQLIDELKSQINNNVKSV